RFAGTLPPPQHDASGRSVRPNGPGERSPGPRPKADALDRESVLKRRLAITPIRANLVEDRTDRSVVVTTSERRMDCPHVGRVHIERARAAYAATVHQPGP